MSAAELLEESSILARKLFDPEPVAWEEVKENDWISCGWKRPRLVQQILEVGGERVLYLAEPDPDRQGDGKYRAVLENEWDARGEWHRFPNMRVLWVAAG